MDSTNWIGPLISAVATIVAALLLAIIKKYGIRFWRNWRTIHVSGNLYFIGKMTPDGSHEVQATIKEQLITNGILKLKGKRAVLKGNYYLKLTTGRNFSGHIKCSGTNDGKNVHLIYNILLDTDKNRNWTGIMIFTLPEWEDITGYYLSKSQRGNYNHGIGYLILKIS